MTTEPFVLVRDPEDDIDVLRSVRALNDPAGGRVVFEVHVSTHATSVAFAALRALGKRSTASAGHERYGRMRALALAWLLAWNIREIFVLRSHIAPQLVPVLRDLCLHAGARMWLIIQQAEIPTAHTELLADHGGHELPLADIPRPRPAPKQAAPPARRPFPTIPRCHFLTLDRICQRLLLPDDAASVIAERNDAANTARRHLRDHRCQDQSSVTSATAGLEHRLSSDPDRNRVITRLYGLQLACFEHGWLTPIDPHRARGTAPAAELFDPAVARALHEYSDTQRPAYTIWTAISAYHAPAKTGWWPDPITLGDVATDGSRAGAIQIPDHLAVFIRAHRHYRITSGATNNDPYFISARTGKRLGRGMARKLLADVALDTGIDARHGARIQTGRTANGSRTKPL